MKTTKKVTKKEIKAFLKDNLNTNKNWAIRGLLRIYDYQTQEEKEVQNTYYHNQVGFTGVDGDILSSFAEQYKNKGYLSPKQMNILYKKMPKYWQQLYKISDQDKLIEIITNQRIENA